MYALRGQRSEQSFISRVGAYTAIPHGAAACRYGSFQPGRRENRQQNGRSEGHGRMTRIHGGEKNALPGKKRRRERKGDEGREKHEGGKKSSTKTYVARGAQNQETNQSSSSTRHSTHPPLPTPGVCCRCPTTLTHTAHAPLSSVGLEDLTQPKTSAIPFTVS